MAYSTQTDLENRIGSKTLAQITNDTAGATTSTTAVVNSLIQQADAVINGKLSRSYATPVEEVLSGTVSSSGTALTGTSSAFTTELSIGDPVHNRATGEIQEIASITSATAATTSTAFTTPLSTSTLYRIPQLIHSISVDLACFYGMQRRFSNMEMPADWVRVYDRIMGTPQMKGLLDQIADQEIDISISVSSESSAIVSPTALIDFNDEDKPEYIY